MCHDNEEWCKIWRGIDLSFQNWHEESKRILIRALESPKNFHFNVLLLSKVYIVWVKKVQRSYLSWNWRGIQNLERNRLIVLKLAKEILQILTWALKSLKYFHFNGLLLSKIYIVWAKKVEELSFMKLKRDTRFGEKSTCHFKTDIWNLTNFDLSTQKSQTFSL